MNYYDIINRVIIYANVVFYAVYSNSFTVYYVYE